MLLGCQSVVLGDGTQNEDPQGADLAGYRNKNEFLGLGCLRRLDHRFHAFVPGEFSRLKNLVFFQALRHQAETGFKPEVGRAPAF